MVAVPRKQLHREHLCESLSPPRDITGALWLWSRPIQNRRQDIVLLNYYTTSLFCTSRGHDEWKRGAGGRGNIPPLSLEWLYKYEADVVRGNVCVDEEKVHHNLANQMGHEHEHRLDDQWPCLWVRGRGT